MGWLGRVVAAGSAAATIGVATAGATGAAPERETTPVTCDGMVFDVVVAGGGVFAPGLVVGSNQVLHPVAFGELTITIRDTTGTIVEQFTEPAMERRGEGHLRRDLLDCSFTFTDVGDGSDPFLPAGFTVTGEGTVTVWISGQP